MNLNIRKVERAQNTQRLEERQRKHVGKYTAKVQHKNIKQAENAEINKFVVHHNSKQTASTSDSQAGYKYLVIILIVVCMLYLFLKIKIASEIEDEILAQAPNIQNVESQDLL